MVLGKEIAFALWRDVERRWKRNVGFRVSSVIVVLCVPILLLLLLLLCAVNEA